MIRPHSNKWKLAQRPQHRCNVRAGTAAASSNATCLTMKFGKQSFYGNLSCAAVRLSFTSGSSHLSYTD